MRKKFITFLKLHNALIPFICNLAIKEYESADSLSLSEHFKRRKGDEMNLIATAFLWPVTSGKENYWCDLSIRWKRLIHYDMEDIS